MPKGNGDSIEGTKLFSAHEHGIALAFEHKHRDELRFCHTSGKWYRWTGARWERNETQLAFDYARTVCAEHNVESKATLASSRTARGVEAFAKAARAFAVTADTWDKDPYLLGTPGGTVDLRTGELREARRKDFITKLTAVTPLKGPHPKWDKFLDEVTSGDRDLTRYLQQISGYCLTGDISEQQLFFIYGNGQNGKGVLAETCQTMLGDYALTSGMETFTATKYQAHPTEIAKLDGARMVVAQETEEGRAWNETRIKAMTGGGKLSAHFMRQDDFEFLPQFKLLFTGNHKPSLRNVGDAERRRFNIIPFRFKPAVVDKNLVAALNEELPQILAWAIDGCLDWQDNGLVRPAVVETETNEYFSEQDTFQKWLDEWCAPAPLNVDELSATLFESWQAYALKSNERPGNIKRFTENMDKRGYRKGKRTSGVGKDQAAWFGIKITYSPPEPSTESEERSEKSNESEERSEKSNENNASSSTAEAAEAVPYTSHTRAHYSETGKPSAPSAHPTPEAEGSAQNESQPFDLSEKPVFDGSIIGSEGTVRYDGQVHRCRVAEHIDAYLCRVDILDGHLNGTRVLVNKRSIIAGGAS